MTAWLASLNLSFERNQEAARERTVIARRRHSGPLLVQRPFYEADGTCQVYVLHPPGGVVGGDELSLSCELQHGARVLLTTPAATKFYRSAGPIARQRQTFGVGNDASLEWLPQESILYDAARVDTLLRVDLAQSAHFTGWEISCLGYDDKGFGRGDYVQRWSLFRQERMLWGERASVAGEGAIQNARWGLGGRSVFGTLVSTGADDAMVERIRAEVRGGDADWFSVTRSREILVCRYLGYRAEAAKKLFVKAWALLRPSLSGREAVLPRVWAT